MLATAVALAGLFLSQAAAQTREASLFGQHIVGYQGWFGCPGDGAPGGWSHWFRPGTSPTNPDLTFDLWPDTAELDPDERCRTALRLASGQPAEVFSSANAKTVRRHFAWMREYDIDSAAFQRFVAALAVPGRRARLDKVLSNVLAAAQSEGRGLFVMYDLSGAKAGSLVATIEDDWRRLSGQWQIARIPAYIRHLGAPVVGLWGIGFKHVDLHPDDAMRLLRFFRDQGVTVVGGVPSYWRTRTRDARPEPLWSDIYRAIPVLSPWTVGRYTSPSEAADFARDVIAPDKAAAIANGQDYLPVVFPGFSWHNLKGAPLGQIPRLCGQFYQAQVQNLSKLGASMLYTAMFDEVDEGTAIFKIVPRSSDLPVGVKLLAPDPPSCVTSSDHYLRLAGNATALIRLAAERRRDGPGARR